MGERFVRLFDRSWPPGPARRRCRSGHPRRGRARLLRTWNDDRRALPARDRARPDRRAGRSSTPDAIAVRCGRIELTLRRAGGPRHRLAQRLRAHGVGVKTPVGVLCERGPLLLPVLLAILKTGGHYMPARPGLPPGPQGHAPPGRRAHPRLPPAGTAGTDLGDVVVLADRRSPTATRCRGRDPVVDPENLAYVIYTSGRPAAPRA